MAAGMEIEAIPFPSASEAIQHTYASGRGVSVRVEGINGYLVVEQKVADLLAENGVSFCYYFDHDLPDGSNRIVTVPVN